MTRGFFLLIAVILLGALGAINYSELPFLILELAIFFTLLVSVLCISLFLISAYVACCSTQKNKKYWWQNDQLLFFTNVTSGIFAFAFYNAMDVIIMYQLKLKYGIQDTDPVPTSILFSLLCLSGICFSLARFLRGPLK